MTVGRRRDHGARCAELRALTRCAGRRPRRRRVLADGPRPRRPHGGDRRRRRLGALPGPASTGELRAASGRHAARGRRRALHARWPHARHHGRRQRRDPVGRPQGGGRARRCPGTPDASSRPQITRDGRTLYTAGLDGTRVRLGPRRRAPPRPAVRHRPRPATGFAQLASAALALSSDGRLIASGPRRRRGQHRGRAHAGAARVVPRSSVPDRVTGLGVRARQPRSRRGRHRTGSWPSRRRPRTVDPAPARPPRETSCRRRSAPTDACSSPAATTAPFALWSAARRPQRSARRCASTATIERRRSSAPTDAGWRSCSADDEQRRAGRSRCGTRTRRARVARLAVPDTPTRRALQPGRPAAGGRATPTAGHSCGRPTTGSRSPACSPAMPATSTRLAISPDGRTLATGSSDRHSAAVGHREPAGDRRAAAGPGRGVGAVTPYFTPDGAAAHRQLRHRPRVPLGHPARVARAPRLPGRRPAPHARRMDGVPPGRDYDPAC